MDKQQKAFANILQPIIASLDSDASDMKSLTTVIENSYAQQIQTKNVVEEAELLNKKVSTLESIFRITTDPLLKDQIQSRLNQTANELLNSFTS